SRRPPRCERTGRDVARGSQPGTTRRQAQAEPGRGVAQVIAAKPGADIRFLVTYPPRGPVAALRPAQRDRAPASSPGLVGSNLGVRARQRKRAPELGVLLSGVGPAHRTAWAGRG